MKEAMSGNKLVSTNMLLGYRKKDRNWRVMNTKGKLNESANKPFHDGSDSMLDRNHIVRKNAMVDIVTWQQNVRHNIQ